ncbi:hypothetical protein [Microlunatus soli]|nr:hypothetical protein [Microlunatus soli]
MSWPSPTDLADAPLWRNYVVAQCVQAALGELPRHVVAYGVSIDESEIELQFQLSEIVPDDRDSIDEIVDDLETLIGPHVNVAVTRKHVSQPNISPHDGIAWIFIAPPEHRGP